MFSKLELTLASVIKAFYAFETLCVYELLLMTDYIYRS